MSFTFVREQVRFLLRPRNCHSPEETDVGKHETKPDKDFPPISGDLMDGRGPFEPVIEPDQKGGK